ncbi:MAG: penicillin-binding protein 2 [Alphaproteobacteria bacterium]|nr:penicillin-binding protein 2 [Alphaproteobacteria bacterium]MBN2675552.1 penicillin-binding protein 2 [Alphaproteobacteria bacterium]
MFEVGKDVLKNGFKVVGTENIGRGRVRFVYSIFVIAFAIFIIRTLSIGIQGTSRTRLAGGDNVWNVSRADIIDRNGDILAKNIMSGHIVLRPTHVKDRDAVAALIHNTLPFEYTVSQALDLINSSRSFIYVKKLATEYQLNMINNAKLPGLSIENIQNRVYPKQRLFSHIVGFVERGGNGADGVERIFDNYLRENKDPLRLSLDSRIQSVFYDQLSLAMKKYDALSATGMLMNSRTGEIIAIVSLPDYDPENRNLDPVRNRMFMPMRGLYEMGSIFKIFNTAMAFENGINHEFYIEKPYKILDKFGRTAATIGDISSFKPPRPNLSVSEIMLHSCNVGSAQIALELPEGAQQEFFKRIHMDEPLDLEFGKTERPLNPRNWGPVEKATVAFGHGISVTPIHTLLAVNAMVNGGIYIYPTLQKRGIGAIQGERIISPKISETLRGIMFRIAEETSGKNAKIPGINIGGKTATAEKRINGKIDKRKNLTAFIGAFPIEAPQYTIFILLDEPKGTKESFGLRTAAWNAVPTTGKILNDILPLLFN